MTEETLLKGLEMKKRINNLEAEIDFLLDYLPPTRENIKEKGRVGYKARFYQKIVLGLKTFLTRQPERTDLKLREIEVTNEDIRALIDFRVQEQKQLKNDLENLF